MSRIIPAIIVFFHLSSSSFGASISISEVMPNPKGKDSGNEWVELQNNSNQAINIQGWQLKTKKNHQIKEPLIIPPQGIISIANLKATLRNKNETLQLISADNQVVEEVQYANAKEGLSYSKVKYHYPSKTKIIWEWTVPTKNSQNPELIQTLAKIIALKNDSLEVSINDKKLTLQINSQLNKELLKTLFKDHPYALIEVTKNDNTLFLEQFAIEKNKQISKSKNKQVWPLFLLPLISIPLAALHWLTKAPYTLRH